MIENCTQEDYVKFLVKIKAINVGFSNASNVQVQVYAENNVEIISNNKNNIDPAKNTTLKKGSLPSLEEYKWDIIVRIPNEKWNEMKNGSIIGTNALNLITTRNVKYPHIEASQENTRTLSAASLLVSGGPVDVNKDKKVSYFWPIFIIAIIIIACVVGCVYYNTKTKKDRVRLEDEVARDFEMKEAKFDRANDSEDGRISIT